MSRDKDGFLRLESEDDRAEFEAGLVRFREGHAKQRELRLDSNLKNTTSNVQNIYCANGTEYIDMTCFAGDSYDKVQEKSIYDLMRRMKAVAQVVGNYHRTGLLHLDIKPANIFTLPETCELVMLFDFDSVVSKASVTAGGARSYTLSWAAPEQINPMKRRTICEATDIFAVGEMIFHQLTERHSEAEERRSFASYSFEHKAPIFENVNPKAFAMLEDLLHHTICVSAKQRYQTVADLISKLDEIIKIADPKAPYLKSSLPAVQDFFVGREGEIQEIHRMLKENRILFLNGIGGIGKSELAKHYAAEHKDEYDTIIFAPYVSDVNMLLLDDNAIPLYNFAPYPEEKPEEYCARKLKKLRELCDERTLFIVDNLDREDDPDLNKLLDLGCKLLITTRMDFSDYGYGTQLYLDAMRSRDSILALFYKYYTKPLNAEENACVEQIIDLVAGHTMTVELLAKQMMAGRVTPEKMLTKLQEGGISESGKEKVRSGKDGTLSAQNTYAHIQALFDISELKEDEKYILANLSLIPHTGVSVELFHDWCELEDYECINRLVVEGWVKLDKEQDYISLHSVIRELVLTQLSTPKKTWRKIMKSVLSFIDGDGWDGCPYAKKQQFAETFRFMIENVYKKKCSSKLVAKFIRNVSETIDIFGHFLEFENYYKYAVAIQIEQSGDAHNNTALAFLSLSDFYMSVGRLVEAEELCQKALHIWEQIYGTESNSYMKACVALASIKKEQQDYPSAEKLMKQAIFFYEATKGAESKKYLHCLDLLGDIYLSSANYENALECLHDCLNKRLKKWGDDSISADSTRFSLSVCYRCMGDYPQAIYYGEIAFQNRQRRNGENHHSLAIVCSSLGYSYLLNDNLASAKEYLWKALILRQNMYGDMHRRTAESYLRMGLVYEKESDIEKAIEFISKSVSIRTALLGYEHADTIDAINVLEKLRAKET
jgi:tetratricopeptide (TPR) repeat protein